MIWSMTKFASVCAVGLLFLPGNEVHRAKVLDGFASALQNAASYCDYQPATCDSFAQGVQTVSHAVSEQLSRVRSELGDGRRYPQLKEAQTWPPSDMDYARPLPRSQ